MIGFLLGKLMMLATFYVQHWWWWLYFTCSSSSPWLNPYQIFCEAFWSAMILGCPFLFVWFMLDFLNLTSKSESHWLFKTRFQRLNLGFRLKHLGCSSWNRCFNLKINSGIYFDDLHVSFEGQTWLTDLTNEKWRLRISVWGI